MIAACTPTGRRAVMIGHMRPETETMRPERAHACGVSCRFSPCPSWLGRHSSGNGSFQSYQYTRLQNPVRRPSAHPRAGANFQPRVAVWNFREQSVDIPLVRKFKKRCRERTWEQVCRASLRQPSIWTIARKVTAHRRSIDSHTIEAMRTEAGWVDDRQYAAAAGHSRQRHPEDTVRGVLEFD